VRAESFTELTVKISLIE